MISPRAVKVRIRDVFMPARYRIYLRASAVEGDSDCGDAGGAWHGVKGRSGANACGHAGSRIWYNILGFRDDATRRARLRVNIKGVAHGEGTR